MGVWERLSGKLATATGRDFERRVLPLLRVLWPDMAYPPELGPWDRRGIDLMVWADDAPFPCVVQCKGFKDQRLGEDHVRQVAESVARFSQSDHRCEQYILLHNRTGEDRRFFTEVEGLLQELSAHGKANAALLWDRQTFLNTVKARLHALLRERLLDRPRLALERLRHVFRFGDVYIPEVPAAEKRLVVQRGALAKVEEVVPTASRQISDLVLSPTGVRWTLLTGLFGSGKTTTSLMAASRTTGTVMFVSCETLRTNLGTGTNELLRSTIPQLGLFDEFGDDDRSVLDPLTAPLLTGLLRDRKTAAQTTLILDGLDENRAFSTVNGMQQLSNCLAELVCPIILTTRTEHFNSTFGTFEMVVGSPSRKGGGDRAARIFELGSWGDSEVEGLVRAALEVATESEAPHVRALLDAISGGDLWEYFGDLPRHPLFLQMILDVVAAHGLHREGRATLIDHWVSVKIRRDLEKPRALPIEDIADVNAFVDQMMRVMERVAGAMVVTDGTERILSETVGSDVVMEHARAVFAEEKVNEVGVALTSVLVPAESRRREVFQFKFVFRVLQEFFLAKHLRRQGLSAAHHPESVRSLLRDLEQAG